MGRKKSKLLLKIVTIVLVALTLISVGLLIISPKNTIETVTEIISIIVGVAALAIAIIAQIAADREEKRLHGIITKLQDLIDDDKAEVKFDATVNKKLNEILADLHHKKK